MSLYDEATQSKECPKCEQVFTGEDVVKNFFKLASTKDHYARVCKKCYYVKADPTVVRERTDKAMERKYAKFVAAEPIKERTNKPYSHTDVEIKRIETTSGLKFIEWTDMGDMWMPRFARPVK